MSRLTDFLSAAGLKKSNTTNQSIPSAEALAKVFSSESGKALLDETADIINRICNAGMAIAASTIHYDGEIEVIGEVRGLTSEGKLFGYTINIRNSGDLRRYAVHPNITYKPALEAFAQLDTLLLQYGRTARYEDEQNRFIIHTNNQVIIPRESSLPFFSHETIRQKCPAIDIVTGILFRDRNHHSS